MSKFLWNALLAGPAVLGASLVISTSALAAEAQATAGKTTAPATNASQLANLGKTAVANPTGLTVPGQQTTSETLVVAQATEAAPQVPAAALQVPAASDDLIAQGAPVTSVSQLSDVDPSSWAFQALQSLIERYGCIAGYPDGTYRGNRALTRYEFAAGLYACLNSLAERLGGVSGGDLATLRRLQEEFAAELATLRGRVDALEARTNELEANQFSTTTKLTGEAIFQPVYPEGDIPVGPVAGDDGDTNVILGYRARLNFDTSFTGEDRLRIRLQAADNERLDAVTGTNMARYNFDTDTGGEFDIDDLYYRFPIGENSNIYISAADTEFYDGIDTFSPLDSSGTGALSRFTRINPIYRLGEGTGVLANFGFGERVTLSGGYLVPTDTATVATGDNGLTDGEFSAIAQLGFEPTDNIGIGLTYVRSYLPDGTGLDGDTGSAFANAPFAGAPLTANSFGAEVNLRLGNRLGLSGWAGYQIADAEDTTDRQADLLNWAATLSFPDLFREGNLAAVTFGQPPKVIDSDFAGREDPDTSYVLEGLYRFQVTENISITPGAYVIFNPEHNEANDNVYVGTIRTTFSF